MKDGWVCSCVWLPMQQSSLALILRVLLINSATPINENSYKMYSQHSPILSIPLWYYSYHSSCVSAYHLQFYCILACYRMLFKHHMFYWQKVLRCSCRPLACSCGLGKTRAAQATWGSKWQHPLHYWSSWVTPFPSLQASQLVLSYTSMFLPVLSA